MSNYAVFHSFAQMCTIGLSFALSCSSSLLLCRLCPRRLFSLAPTAHWWEFSPSSSSSSLPLSIWYAELPNHFTRNNSVSNTLANNLISSKETVWSQMLLKIPILSSFTHPYVDPNTYDFLSSTEHIICQIVQNVVICTIIINDDQGCQTPKMSEKH